LPLDGKKLARLVAVAESPVVAGPATFAPGEGPTFDGNVPSFTDVAQEPAAVW
jgi:hypothetical protein